MISWVECFDQKGAYMWLLCRLISSVIQRLSRRQPRALHQVVQPPFEGSSAISKSEEISGG
jgi:hypothetical protein